MSPEQIQEILKICEATEGEGGFRELPPKTTLTVYLAKGGVGLTVGSIEAVIVRGASVQARTTKGDLYVLSLDDVFTVSIEGRAKAKAERRAGFA